MSNKEVFKEYKKNQIINANQSKLVLMLYDGAIKFINKAIELIPQKKPKNIEEIHKNIVKAQDIITELTSSLDMNVGDISQKLFSIYMYINNKLIEANVKKNEKPLIEARKYLTELREAWEKASKNPVVNENKKNDGRVNIAT